MNNNSIYAKIIIFLITGWIISLISIAGIMYTAMGEGSGRSGSVQANGIFNAINSSHNIIIINGEELEQSEE